MRFKYVIEDKLEGCLTFSIIGYDKDDAYEELCIVAGENNFQDWEILEEYEIT